MVRRRKQHGQSSFSAPLVRTSVVSKMKSENQRDIRGKKKKTAQKQLHKRPPPLNHNHHTLPDPKSTRGSRARPRGRNPTTYRPPQPTRQASSPSTRTGRVPEHSCTPSLHSGNVRQRGNSPSHKILWLPSPSWRRDMRRFADKNSGQ